MWVWSIVDELSRTGKKIYSGKSRLYFSPQIDTVRTFLHSRPYNTKAWDPDHLKSLQSPQLSSSIFLHFLHQWSQDMLSGIHVPYTYFSWHTTDVSLLIRHHSQLIVTFTLAFKVWHGHNFDHQTCPSSEMLSSLSVTSFGVVLLPCKSSFFPRVVDSVDEVFAETGVKI